MKKISTILLLIFVCAAFSTNNTLYAFSVSTDKYSVKSPAGNIEVLVCVGKKTEYSVLYNGKTIITPSPVSMTFTNGIVIGDNMRVAKVETIASDKILKPVVKQKSATIKDQYNEMILKSNGYDLRFRVYDDGLAYRFTTNFKDSVNVLQEEASFCFPNDYAVLFPEEKNMLTAQQPLFRSIKLSEIAIDKIGSTPMMVKPDSTTCILISESDLESFPGMYLSRGGKNTLIGKHAGYALTEEDTPGRQRFPVNRANYIAKTKGTRTYPWRAIMIGDDKSLVANQLIYKLAPDAQGDFSWVKPGKIAWDWWNGLNIYGVDFKAGINTQTYKYFVDFASQYGIEYVVIDDGWSQEWDVTKVIPDIDMQELISYAAAKNVGIILWVTWAPFEDQMDQALALYSKWGVKGLKIDFMNRDDQRVVDFYYEVARKAAGYKMLVDFHGAYKPTGWLRAFPNVLTSEGVAGLEQCKWCNFATPKHNVTLPFTRMAAGPMDYTPGGMINSHHKDFTPVYNTPATIGTRCHQLGMYVVYESPLQMLADTPSNYYKEKECMEFLSAVPVVWDETIVLKAAVGKYIIVARRDGDTWYIGGMTGEKGGSFEIDLSFIKGERTLVSWEDGINVAMQASDYKKSEKKVKEGDKITVTMYDGGGYVAIIK
ncbi:MAG: glycoside hydrolase family 97 protein [Bacteroidales bacterium]